MNHRNSKAYYTEWWRHRRRTAYYVKGLVHHVTPYGLCHRWSQQYLNDLDRHPDREALLERVNYYCSLTEPFDASDAVPIADVSLGQSRYYIDFEEHARGFGRERKLWYTFGDVTWVPEHPSIVKSRPIGPGAENAVLLNLDKLRHFSWSPDPLPFREKKPAAVWRGVARTPARRLLLEKFNDHPEFNIGHSGPSEPYDLPPGKTPMSHNEQKHYRYFLALEGFDVATSLKWGMASNMLVMSPALHFETWFMEGKLEPNKHFVLLADDFSDLEEKVAYFNENPAEAEEIIENAHRWLDQFADLKTERMISAGVLRKYFSLSNQM